MVSGMTAGAVSEDEMRASVDADKAALEKNLRHYGRGTRLCAGFNLAGCPGVSEGAGVSICQSGLFPPAALRSRRIR